MRKWSESGALRLDEEDDEFEDIDGGRDDDFGKVKEEYVIHKGLRG